MSATEPPEDLSSVGPFGFLTQIGWNAASVETRSRAIVGESQMRLAGAAEVITSMCINMEETRKAALLFVAHSLRDTARLLEQVRRAERASAAAEERRLGERKARPRKAGRARA